MVSKRSVLITYKSQAQKNGGETTEMMDQSLSLGGNLKILGGW